MGIYIVLRYTKDMPASPLCRQVESFALADRRTLGCRFGEPCNPRKMITLYDVDYILETYESYEAYYGRSLKGEFEGLQRWSGVSFQVGNGYHLMLINPEHDHLRRTFTIAHEFGHLVLGHKPIVVKSDSAAPQVRYSDDQELEAYQYGLAVLLPYAPLLQMLRQGATTRGIAHHYGVSVPAVEMRLKLTGLWEMRS